MNPIEILSIFMNNIIHGDNTELAFIMVGMYVYFGFTLMSAFLYFFGMFCDYVYRKIRKLPPPLSDDEYDEIMRRLKKRMDEEF